MLDGALVLAWSSDEYIGTGLHLELTQEETKVNSSTHPTTKAELVKLNGGRVVESKLYLVASSDNPSATVTCFNVAHNESSISFKIPGMCSTLRYVDLTTF